MTASGTVKLNIGSGAEAVAGWINVDKSPALLLARSPRVRGVLARVGVLTERQRAGFSRDVVYGDATRRLRFADRSVDFVYSSHMIEHLSRQQGLAFLQEVRRILRPAGTVRLATPDLAQLISEYQAAGRQQGYSAGDDLMSRFHFYHQSDDEGVVKRLISRNLSGHWHQWLYDDESLRTLLDQAGFEEIRRAEFQQGEFPDLELIEGRPESLFVQAQTPPAG